MWKFPVFACYASLLNIDSVMIGTKISYQYITAHYRIVGRNENKFLYQLGT